MKKDWKQGETQLCIGITSNPPSDVPCTAGSSPPLLCRAWCWMVASSPADADGAGDTKSNRGLHAAVQGLDGKHRAGSSVSAMRQPCYAYSQRKWW